MSRGRLIVVKDVPVLCNAALLQKSTFRAVHKESHTMSNDPDNESLSYNGQTVILMEHEGRLSIGIQWGILL